MSYVPHRLGPGSLLSDEERKRRKKERNAAYREANRSSLAKDKRNLYAAKKAGELLTGRELVYDVNVAYKMALRVERNDRYRARVLKSQRNRAYYERQKIQYGQKNGPELPPILQVNGAGGCGK